METSAAANINSTFQARPISRSTPKSSRGRVVKSNIIDGGSFDWRLAYWWVAGAWVLFSYSQSISGALALGTALAIPFFWTVVICISLTGAEGVIVAWLTCPQRGLVSKRQERNLRFGSYAVTFFQILEVGLFYAYKLIGGNGYLWGMGMAATAMLVTAILTVKNVIQHSEGRQKALEESDTRIEEAIASAKIKSMKARHHLQAKKSIIDIEARVLRMEKMQAMRALETKESRKGIEQIGQGRAAAVIQATAQNMQNYAVKMLLDSKPVNSPVNPRSINGSGIAKK